MQYFIALLPPQTLLANVLAFRAQWQVRDTAPHITLKAPCGLGPEENWLPTVRQLCQATPHMPVQIDEVGTFGEKVLMLRVSSAEMVALHLRLIHALAISTTDQATCFEGSRYSPHLTLLYSQSVRETPFSALGQAARDWFTTPQTFRAEKVAIYRKAPGDTYRHHLEIPLLSLSETET